MTDQVNRIVDHILKSKKISPEKISALADVIRALTLVKKEVQDPNLIKEEIPDQDLNEFQSLDFSQIQEIEIEGRAPRKVVIN